MAAGRRATIACGFIVLFLSVSAWAQSPDQPTTSSFRVSWHPSTGAPIPTIEGQVANPSTAWVTDVRLRVEGLDAAGQAVGTTFTSTLGDILPGGEAPFLVEPVPGAVDYRISVASFYVVSLSQPPAPVWPPRPS
jgi:hypothetical protein